MPSAFAKYLDDNLIGDERSKREKAKAYINSVAHSGGDSDPNFADKVEDIFQEMFWHQNTETPTKELEGMVLEFLVSKISKHQTSYLHRKYVIAIVKALASMELTKKERIQKFDSIYPTLTLHDRGNDIIHKSNVRHTPTQRFITDLIIGRKGEVLSWFINIITLIGLVMTAVNENVRNFLKGVFAFFGDVFW